MIGEEIRALRQRRGMSLGALAIKSQVCKSTLSCWECGKRKPSTRELKSVIDALNLRPTESNRVWQLLDEPRGVRALRQAIARQRVSDNGTLLRSLRQRAGLTQQQVADALGVTRWTVLRWEKIEIWPEPAQLDRLIALFSPDEEQTFLLRAGRFAPEYRKNLSGEPAALLAQ
ncbi:MAG: helix-turn-helix transcriptional regulator [Capsulimonadales bacterium]|nr:helix-turn-helix transcriptional regulator [Capsulimonadales bacterium]